MGLSRRNFIIIVIVCLLLPSVQPTAAMGSDKPTVLIILSKDIAPYKSVSEGIRSTLESGREKLVINELVLTEGNVGRVIHEHKPDLLLPVGSSALRKIISDRYNIPVIYAAVLDPPPATNDIAGGALLRIPVAIQFQRLKTVLPQAARVGVIYNPSQNAELIEEAENIASQFDLILRSFPIRSPEEIPRLEHLDIDVLWMVPDSMLKSSAVVKHLLIATFKAGIPVMGVSPGYVKAGALFALSCDYEDIGRQAGEISLQVLSERHAKILPPARPRISNLYVNLAVARKLRVPIQKKILSEAHTVLGQ